MTRGSMAPTLGRASGQTWRNVMPCLIYLELNIFLDPVKWRSQIFPVFFSTEFICGKFHRVFLVHLSANLEKSGRFSTDPPCLGVIFWWGPIFNSRNRRKIPGIKDRCMFQQKKVTWDGRKLKKTGFQRSFFFWTKTSEKLSGVNGKKWQAVVSNQTTLGLLDSGSGAKSRWCFGAFFFFANGKVKRHPLCRGFFLKIFGKGVPFPYGCFQK